MKETIFCLFLLIGTLCAEDHNQVQETIDFLENGEKEFHIDDNYRDLTLLIGITGTGKSTLTQFMAGNLTDLKSVQKSRTVYLIESTKPDIIGNSTTVSQTIYPNFVTDELNSAYYDCPGFDDSRNASIEIAATYFIKKVVEHATTIRFVLVSNYNGVTIGESRDDFPRLVKHLYSFIRNLANYRGSISLVATKAPNETYNDLQLNIADFLEEYRGEQVKLQDSNPMARYAVELLDILLTSRDNGTTFEKIAVFKKPTEPGPLNELPKMVEARELIRDIVLNRTTYAKKIIDDFGYTISDSSKLKLVDIVGGINDGIEDIVKQIGAEIQSGYEADNSQLGNLVVLIKRYQLAHGNLTAIKEGAAKLTPELFIARLKQAAVDLNVTVSGAHLEGISNRTLYIRFLQNFTTEALSVKVADWVDGLDDCIKHLETNGNWYRFLSDIYAAYSAYEFRGKIDKYNVSNLDNWGKGGDQGIHIDSENFQQFAQVQTVASLVQNLKPTQFQLDTLNRLLEATIRQRPTITCDKDNAAMTIEADYVRLSDIQLALCGDSVQHLYIFALHTVYIDFNLRTPGRALDVSILATRWYIWGDREITVGGADGGVVAKDAAAASTKSDEAGAAGIPGLPGGPSGHFVGLGLNFESDDKLKVHVVGGKGGRGQEGGAGFIGQAADVSGIPESSRDRAGEEAIKSKSYRKVEQISKPDCYDRADTHSSESACTTPWYVYGACSFTSGDGGSGGNGGRPGQAKVFAPGKSAIVLLIEKGPSGEAGKAGAISDEMPKKVKMEYHYHYATFGGTTASWKEVGRDNDDSCPKAAVGTDGKNSAGIIQPEEPHSIDTTTPINKFDAFVRANLEHPFIKDNLVAVLDVVSKSKN